MTAVEMPGSREPLARATASDQVVTGHIPQEPPGFQPRADLLGELDRAGAGVSVVHTVTGLPGAGKTQLAAACARAKLAEGWRLVAWVNAGDTRSLQAGLAAVADAVGLHGSGSGQDATSAGKTVRDHLETDGDRCLLVFDDAKDPEALRPFIPAGGAARVLITTARQSVVNLGTGVPVEPFTTDEALAFMAGRTGPAGLEEAADVAAELGHLPLALAQAAGLIGAEQQGSGTYLDRLRAVPVAELLGREDRRAFPYRLAEAVLLSLEAVAAADEADVCTRMMQIIAVLSAAGVSRELMSAAGQAGALASGGLEVAALQVDRALEQLAERSLLTFTLHGQGIIVHPLIARVMRDKLARSEGLTTACQAAASVLAIRVKQLEGSRDRLALRDISLQVAALVDNAASPAVERNEELTRLLVRLRLFALYYLIELGDSASQAIAAGEPLTADLEWMLGPDHPDTLRSRNSLAVAYQEAGRAGEAIELFEQTLVGRERVLGPKHPDTLTSQHNLAGAYQEAGRVDEAIRLFELTLAARERLLGGADPSTLNTQGNLATAYREAGRADEAIELFEQTLVGLERVLGIDHPDTVRSRNILANAYWETGRVAEAIPLAELILAARERQLGADHPSTLASRNNLAAAYRARGLVDEAIPLYQQSLDACERLLGTDDHRTLASRNSLAVAYLAAGLADEAIPLFEQILAARERLLGVDDPETLASRNSLALAYQEAGQAEQAVTAGRALSEPGSSGSAQADSPQPVADGDGAGEVDATDEGDTEGDDEGDEAGDGGDEDLCDGDGVGPTLPAVVGGATEGAR
jgi:tetratricopeptide (TPR) repeat protein